VLQHLLIDFEDKLLILIQFVDEIKTLVFSLYMHNVLKGDGVLCNLFSELLEASTT